MVDPAAKSCKEWTEHLGILFALFLRMKPIHCSFLLQLELNNSNKSIHISFVTKIGRRMQIIVI